jgi:starch synthase (maltosyl-transferring)
MSPLINDRWSGGFYPHRVGRYQYTIEAWVDRYLTWLHNVIKKYEAEQDVAAEVIMGAQLLQGAIKRASQPDAKVLSASLELIESLDSLEGKLEVFADDDVVELMEANPDLTHSVLYPQELTVVIDRQRAEFGAWYEMFPRSAPTRKGESGTLKDCEAMLPYISSMGFDVLYLPPIHPIGRTKRKGPNNAPNASENDPGSPWAIGAVEGGHTEIHPELGSMEDFQGLLRKVKEHNMELAMDLAFQCSPDHPWVKEHPEWFMIRPDGKIQYAENPPKKYEDIYPLNFESDQWLELWGALRDVVFYWLEQGVRIFRVDNPHTKPFRFWEWLIDEVKREYPETIFLAEAFTRPKIMLRLAKIGFSQSYTYFAWRNTKYELENYMKQLVNTQVEEYFRPNLWPNTPDILTEYLQLGGREAFITRLILAATLGASYGIYGPAFELCDNRAVEFGSEEYLNSEKYQVRDWDLASPDSLRDIVARVNKIRRDNPALHSNATLQFHWCDNEQIMAYSKHTEDFSNIMLCVVNLDPNFTQSGWIHFPIEELGMDPEKAFQVHDMLSGARFLWRGGRNYVQIDPSSVSGHIFRVRLKVRTEKDFDYYM